MRRGTIFTAALVTAVFGLLLGSQVGSAKGGKVVAWATGSGHHLSGGKFRTFAFSARQYEDGTDTGQAQLRGRDPAKTIAHLRVTCLTVVGQTAHMAGVVKKIKPVAAAANQVVGANVAFSVMDAGATGDMVSPVAFSAPGGTPTCTTGATPSIPVERGQVKVRAR